MDLNLLLEKFKELFDSTDFADKVEYSNEGNSIEISFNIQFANLDDDVRVGINIYSNGGFILDYIFDKFDLNVDTCEFINQYNKNVLFFKAFVNDSGYLEIVSSTLDAIDETDVLHKVTFLMNNIVDEDNFVYLIPLTQITE